MENSILVIDDELDFLDSVRRGLLSAGFKNLRLEMNPLAVATLLRKGETFDIALIDITMPGMDGVTLLDRIRNYSPNTQCIMVTASNEAKVAVDCLKKGAYDYLVKPILRENLVAAIKNALERERLRDILNFGKRKVIPKLTHEEAFQSIITSSPRMIRILKEAELHAGSNVPILITGGSGTGKELLAKAIHLASSRAKFPFTPINASPLSGSLFVSEFFGYEKGAFTGADRDRKGYLEYTNRGTLFLDEIGDLTLEFQGKLLRVLQDGEYIKLGTNTPRKADVRFIAATNRDLDQMMAKGTFRKDLYYRLKGAWIHLPPLKERKEDIPLLIHHFLKEFCCPAGNITAEEEALPLLLAYDYPGNIRELRSILQSAVNLAQGKPISIPFLPGVLRTQKQIIKKDSLSEEAGPVMSLLDVEKSHIIKIYERNSRNKIKTSHFLGIGLNTLRRKLELYGIE